jgi:hypothetical protein
MLFAAGRFVAIEALSIRVHDVDFDAHPAKLFIRGDEGHSFVYRADEYKYRTRRVSDSDKEKVNFQHTVGTMILILTLEGLWTVLENVAKNTVVIIASISLERARANEEVSLLSLGVSRRSEDGIISISYEQEYQHYNIVQVCGTGLRYDIKGIKN